MQRLFTTREVARALAVSDSSLRRWCDQGLLETERTEGGHRRVPLTSVVSFLRKSGHQLAVPQILGLPEQLKLKSAADAGQQPVQLLCSALEQGREREARRLTLDAFLDGTSSDRLCDGLIAPAFSLLGQRWVQGQLEIYQERRACEIARRLLSELRSLLADLPADAPKAIGGTPSGDPFRLATQMVELALRENGWQAQNLGVDLPLATFRRALEEHRPHLIWLSVSHVPNAETFLSEYQELQETASRLGTTIVLGGRGLDDEIRHQMKGCQVCSCMSDLVALLKSLVRQQNVDSHTVNQISTVAFSDQSA